MPGLIYNMCGRRFGWLRVPGGSKPEIRGHAAYWPTVCDCGNQIMVRGAHLRSGKVKSWGCYRAAPDVRRKAARTAPKG